MTQYPPPSPPPLLLRAHPVQFHLLTQTRARDELPGFRERREEGQRLRTAGVTGKHLGRLNVDMNPSPLL